MAPISKVKKYRKNVAKIEKKNQIFGGIAMGDKIYQRPIPVIFRHWRQNTLLTPQTNLQTIPLKNEAKIVKVPNGETFTNHK